MRKLWLLTFAFCLSAATLPAGAQTLTGNLDTDKAALRQMGPVELARMRGVSTVYRDEVDKYIQGLVADHKFVAITQDVASGKEIS